MKPILLDGPLGTQLDARGVDTTLPLWSASAIDSAPDVVRQIHRDYIAAGAIVQTANTFRTKRRTAGDDWERLTREAVALTRHAIESSDVPSQSQRIAGCISPLEDCYRPDLSPEHPESEHREMAEALAEAGCDLLLCETFPHVGEAVAAVGAGVKTGIETWVAFTAGPDGDLLSLAEIDEGARRAVDQGASAILVNCIPATMTLRFVERLAGARLGVPIGAYANAGRVDDNIGWQSSTEPGAATYAKFARSWIDAGATIIGGCCGTGPEHIKAIGAI